MLTTPTHHNRRLRAGAVLATFGLGLPVGMAPALAETLAAQAEVKVEASATTDAGTADSDDEAGLVGAVKVQADVAVHGYLNGLLDGSGAGGDVLPAVPGLSLDGGLPLIGGLGSGDGEGSGELPTEVLGLLLSGDGDAGLPGAGLPNLGLPGAGLPNLGLPGAGLPGVGLPNLGLPGLGLPGAGLPNLGLPGLGLPGLGLPGAGLPNLGLPGLGLPGLGLPNLGLPGIGLPGLGLPTLPVRLPSLVLPSVVNPSPSGQDDDPAVVNAGHVGPVGGLVNGTEGKAGDAPSPRSVGVPANQPNGGPSQFGGGSSGTLPRTGANLRLRALAAFGLLGLAGLGSRRRRSA